MPHSADNDKLHPHRLLDGRWLHNDLRDSGNIRTRRARRRLASFARLVAEMFNPKTGQLEARSLLITFIDHPNANICDEDTRLALHGEMVELYAMLADGRTEPVPTLEVALEGGDSRSGLCHAHALGSGALDEFVGRKWRNRTVTLPSGQRVRIHAVRVVLPHRIWNTWVYMHKTACSDAIRKWWQTDAEFDRAREQAVQKHQAGKANLTAAGKQRRSSTQFTLGAERRPEAVLLTRNQREGLILLCQSALMLAGAPATTFRGLLRQAARAYQHTERRKRRRPLTTSGESGQGCLRPLLLALFLLALCLTLVRDVPGLADLKLYAAASPARAAVHEHQHRPRHAVGPP